MLKVAPLTFLHKFVQAVFRFDLAKVSFVLMTSVHNKENKTGWIFLLQDELYLLLERKLSYP